MEHSRLLKFLVTSGDHNTDTMSDFKIEYDYQNPTNVEAEVPGSQNIREAVQDTDGAVSNEIDPKEDFTLQPVITITKKEATLTKGDLKLQKVTVTEDLSVSEFRNGGYTVTKRTFTEHSEVIEGTKVTRTTVLVSAGTDAKEIDYQVEDKRPKTKIPKLKFRQAAERVRAERRKSKESQERESHIPIRRSSIPKLSRVSRIPPPTTKPVVTKREVKTIVTSKPDDEFDKIYEEIVEHTDVTGELTDPEKVDSEFEEIIHAYDETNVQQSTPKVRQTRIPLARRRSDHEDEAPKSSTRFAEKSKVRSIPRLKEISRRIKEDNNDIGQIVRQYTKTVATEKITGINDSEDDEGKNTVNNERKSLVKTSKLIKKIKSSEVGLNEQAVTSGEVKVGSVKTSKLTKIVRGEKIGHVKLATEGQKSIGNTEDQMITEINTVTKTNKIIGVDNLLTESKQSINDDNDKIITTTKVTTIIKTGKINDKNCFESEIEKIVDNDENFNIGKTINVIETVKNEKIDDDLNVSSKNKENNEINTIKLSVSLENDNNKALLDNNKAEFVVHTKNTTKTFINKSMPVFNKQVSESAIGSNYTQSSYINKATEISTNEGSSNIPKKVDQNKTQYKTVIKNKIVENKAIDSPDFKDSYTNITHVTSNVNKDDRKEIELTKLDMKNKDINLAESKSIEVNATTPEFTDTATITRMISLHNKEIDDTKTMKIERDEPKISILKFETIPSKVSSSIQITTLEVERDCSFITSENEKENNEEVVELRGKVGRLINKIDTNKLTLSDTPKKDLDEELPNKKSILSKIAMFERQDINESMPQRKPRPEKLHIKEIPKEKSVHIHTPKIVEEVLKPIQTSELKELDTKEESASVYDPFLTYKPLYEHYKNVEMNKSNEFLDSKVDTPKTLEVETQNVQVPLSPLKKTTESKLIKLDNTSSIMVDAPVILASPKIDFKKNINLSTSQNTAEFAKTITSVKETKNIEVLTPVQINLDYEVSKIDVDTLKYPKNAIESKITIFKDAFKDVKKNIAMYENYTDTPQTAYKSTYSREYSVDGKLDKNKSNFEMKIKNEDKHEDTKPINEIYSVKEVITYEKIKPISNLLKENEIAYENIRPINKIVSNDDIKYEIVKPISDIIKFKDDFKNDVSKSTYNEHANLVEAAKEQLEKKSKTIWVTKEYKNEKVRPVSEIITTNTEIQYEKVRPISQIISLNDNSNEIVRSISEIAINKDNNINSKHIIENDDNTDVFIKDKNLEINKFTRNIDDEAKRAKSMAELDLGDVVKGKVSNTILRMKSIERFDFERKEVIHNREIPRMMSVSEKIALFESKATPARSDSVFMSCRPKSIRTPPLLQMTEGDYQLKIEELTNAKHKYGRFEQMPSIELFGGAKMPVLAVGTALLDKRLAGTIVSTAIDLGYRAIDSAYIYGNEKEIGDGIRAKISDGTVQREDLFVISKLWSTYHRPDLVEKACRASLDAMGLTYFDLYLIHNPMSFKEGGDPIPKIATVLQYSQYDYLDAWYGMEELVHKGLVRNIGVSNFNSVQIQRILDKGKIRPVVNQVECHPYLTQQRLHSFCTVRNIILSCFGVLGSKGTPAEYKSSHHPVIDDPLVQVMASGLNMTPAQLLIRYHIECGSNVVVKTTSGFRLWENIQSLNFTLIGQIGALQALNRNKRIFTFSGMGDTHKNYPFRIAY